MVKQGAVKVDGQRVDDFEQLLSPGSRTLLQVGKRRFAHVVID